MITKIKKITSVLVRSVFTLVAFIVLGISIVIAAVDSLVSTILSPLKSLRKSKKFSDAID